MGTVRKGKIEAFVCTECGRDIPADPEVFEEDITEEEIQQIEELYCPDCCGWFMVPVEGPTFGGGYIMATGETVLPQFPKMGLKQKVGNNVKKALLYIFLAFLYLCPRCNRAGPF
jgi:DNA-directed RNA polymerase subunit RPC12/RpoP